MSYYFNSSNHFYIVFLGFFRETIVIFSNNNCLISSFPKLYHSSCLIALCSTSRIMLKGCTNNPIYSCSYLKETTSKPSPLSIIFAIFLLGISYEIKKFPPINIATFL